MTSPPVPSTASSSGQTPKPHQISLQNTAAGYQIRPTALPLHQVKEEEVDPGGLGPLEPVTPTTPVPPPPPQHHPEEEGEEKDANDSTSTPPPSKTPSTSRDSKSKGDYKIMGQRIFNRKEHYKRELAREKEAREALQQELQQELRRRYEVG